MSDLSNASQATEPWNEPRPPSTVLKLPYEDMPGTHRNEARDAAICAVWAIMLSGASGFLLVVGASSTSMDEYGNDEFTPLFALAAVLGVIGSILWAVALWKFLMHRSNEYALMVARVRAEGGFPAKVLEEFRTQPYASLTLNPASDLHNERKNLDPMESTE